MTLHVDDVDVVVLVGQGREELEPIARPPRCGKDGGAVKEGVEALARVDGDLSHDAVCAHAEVKQRGGRSRDDPVELGCEVDRVPKLAYLEEVVFEGAVDGLPEYWRERVRGRGDTATALPN